MHILGGERERQRKKVVCNFRHQFIHPNVNQLLVDLFCYLFLFLLKHAWFSHPQDGSKKFLSNIVKKSTRQYDLTSQNKLFNIPAMGTSNVKKQPTDTAAVHYTLPSAYYLCIHLVTAQHDWTLYNFTTKQSAQFHQTECLGTIFFLLYQSQHFPTVYLVFYKTQTVFRQARKHSVHSNSTILLEVIKM